MKNVHEIEIKLEGKEWTSELDAAFEKKKKDIKVDGFRKGAVPKDVYIKKFGLESLFMDAVDSAINVAYKKVLDEKKLIPVVEPGVDIKDINETAVSFKFTIITKPEVKLGDYKNLKVKQETPKVTKEEINHEIENVLEKMIELVIKEDGEVESGNTAVIDFEGIMDGKTFEGGTGTDYPLEIGSNTFIPGFEEQLIGMKKNDKKDVKLKFPKDYTPELAGKDVTFKVTIKDIKVKVLPELNEELYKDLGYDNIKTEAEFRAEIEKELKARMEVNLEDKYIEDCLAKAASNMKVDINEEILSEEVHRMIHQYEEQLQMQGLSMDQYLQFTGQNHDDLHKTMNPEALKRVKYRYLIEAVADAEKIEISDEEAKIEAEKASKMYGVEADEFIKMIGGLDIMKYDCKMRKAVEIIKG